MCSECMNQCKGHNIKASRRILSLRSKASNYQTWSSVWAFLPHIQSPPKNFIKINRPSCRTFTTMLYNLKYILTHTCIQMIYIYIMILLLCSIRVNTIIKIKQGFKFNFLFISNQWPYFVLGQLAQF